MSIQHVSWPSIKLFHNCVCTLDHLATLGRPSPVVEYRAKAQLHGSNCTVHIWTGAVLAQSRTQLLAPDADYKGFASWVHSNHSWFASLEPRKLSGLEVVHGLQVLAALCLIQGGYQ